MQYIYVKWTLIKNGYLGRKFYPDTECGEMISTLSLPPIFPDFFYLTVHKCLEAGDLSPLECDKFLLGTLDRVRERALGLIGSTVAR